MKHQIEIREPLPESTLFSFPPFPEKSDEERAETTQRAAEPETGQAEPEQPTTLRQIEGEMAACAGRRARE